MAKSCFLTSIALVLCLASTVGAAIPSDSLLPTTTKGYLSVPDVDALRAKWQETQLGQLANDPIMQPFVEDLKEQIKNKLSSTRIRLGITMDDLEDVYGGEVCIATLQPSDDETQHALALLVDVQGSPARKRSNYCRRSLRTSRIRGQGTSIEKIAGFEAHIFIMPKDRADAPQVEAFYFLEKDMLIASDHREIATEIAGRLGGNKVQLPQGCGRVCRRHATLPESVGRDAPSRALVRRAVWLHGSGSSRGWRSQETRNGPAEGAPESGL